MGRHPVRHVPKWNENSLLKSLFFSSESQRKSTKFQGMWRFRANRPRSLLNPWCALKLLSFGQNLKICSVIALTSLHFSLFFLRTRNREFIDLRKNDLRTLRERIGRGGGI